MKNLSLRKFDYQKPLPLDLKYTEAMGCGVVPVVSTAGFNRSICGDDSLVVESLDPMAYANIILNIVDNGKWEEHSRRAYDRVIDNYTAGIVSKKLIGYLKSL